MIIHTDEYGNVEYEEPFVIGFSKKTDFLKLIEAWRKEKKYSYEFLGKLIGLHPSTMSQVFSGYRNITLDNLIKLLRVFGYRLSIQEILERFPEDYFPEEDEIEELDDYQLMKNYIKDYKSKRFKGTYEEYKKVTSDYGG